MRDYVEKKIGKVVSKYRSYCAKVDVHLTVQTSVPAGQAAEGMCAISAEPLFVLQW